MLWYELADADEVKEVLQKLLQTYGFTVTIYDYYGKRDEQGNLPSYTTYPSQPYEMAEALWGEHSEEVFFK